MDIKLYGLEESVYTRIVRLVLMAKEIAFAEIQADPFDGGVLPEDYDLRHPFKRIPAIEIDGMRLYETDAIVHYVDAISGPPGLIPRDPEAAARMRQLMRIVDNYGYRPLVWGVYVPIWWREGQPPAGNDLDDARHVLGVVEQFAADYRDAGFADVTLATFYLASVLAAADSVAMGASLIDERPRLREWWNGFRMHPIIKRTRSKHTKF